MALAFASGGGGGGSGGVTQFDYVEITANVTVTATADGNGGGTAVIDGNAVSYDGLTRISVVFYAPRITMNPATAAHSVYANLYDGTTDLGRLCRVQGDVVGVVEGVSVYGERFLTPAAGSHTYHIRTWKDAAGDTAAIEAGAGGASTPMPAYMRITKA